MGEDNVLHLRGVAAFQHKRELLAAHHALALVGAAECIDPGARPGLTGSGETQDQQCTAGILRDDLLQQLVVLLEVIRVLAVNREVHQRCARLRIVRVPEFLQLAVHAT